MTNKKLVKTALETIVTFALVLSFAYVTLFILGN